MSSLKPWGYGEIGVRDSISLGLNAPDLTGWRGNGVAPFSGFQSGIYGQAKGGLPHFMNAGRSQAGRGTQMTGAFGPAQGDYLGQQRAGRQLGQSLIPALGQYNQAHGLGGDLMGGFAPAAQYYGQQMATNPFDTANRFATNPYVDGMIDASSRDIVRNLGENVLPGIAGQSASTGNLGSSRRGALEAIATRGAADRIGDIGSQLRGSLYGQGLNTGYNQANYGAQGLTGLGQLGMGHSQFGTSGLANLGQFGVNQGNWATNGLMNVGQMGMNMQNQGFNQYQNAMMNGWNMGSQMQNQQQRMIDYQRNRHYQDQLLPFQQAQIMSGLSMNPAQAFGKQGGAMTGNQWIGAGLGLAGGALGAAGMAGGFKPLFGLGQAIGSAGAPTP